VGANAEPADRPCTSPENTGTAAATVPAATPNDDFCFAGKLF
jgi:hypothetical protein